MKKDLRILVLEDVTTDAVIINHELRKGGLTFHAKRVETREDFLRELHQNPPDLILSDHGLSSFDGFTALALARDKCPDTPFIFVTGSVGEERIIESLKSGATDYVLKSRMSSLVPAVQRALRLAEEQQKRRQAERELRESEERFRLLVSGVKDYAIFMLDPHGRVSSWNAGAEWIKGYRSNEIIGQDFGRFYRPEDQERRKPEKDLQTAAAEGRFEEEGWRVRKGGSQFWAHVVIAALRGESGQLGGFTQVTRDITERKQAEEALRQSEERYRRLVELCPDALFVQSDNRIVFANSAAMRLLGAESPEQVIGKPVNEIVHPDYLETVQQHLQQLREEGTTLFWRTVEGRVQRLTGEEPVVPFIEEKFVRLDGSEVDVEVAATPLTYQDLPAIQMIARDITQRKQAEAALRESEVRKTAILETSLDAIVSIDHEGKVREWNPAAERIFGYRRAEALGRLMDELIVPPALRERYLDGLADYLMTGVGSLIGRPIELIARRANGTELPAELAITRIPGREPPMFTAFIRDITERKRAEEELRQTEARMTAIVETALDAIVSIDHQGKIVEWNPAAEKVFGYSRAMALGREMAELIVPPSAAGAHRKGLARYLTSGRGRLIGKRVEMTAMRANGAEFPAELSITRMPGEGPPTFTGCIRDITERRRAEEALRKSEDRFRMLVERVEDYAIYMLDPNGRVVSWNAGAERIEGYRASEIIGRRFHRFFTPEDVERKKPEQALAVATAEGHFQDEGWRVRKDGSRYWASMLITALRDEKGKLNGFSKIARDITKRKKAEDEIRRLNAELEHRVQERTAELETAFHEMEAFSYSISHDLRAPLIHIVGFVEMLQAETGPHLDEKGRRYLKTISESTSQMGKMIDDLLTFSRMSRAEMHKVRVSLVETVKSVLQDLRTELENRHVAWTISELPEVKGDPSLLRQVLFNLISNALKYTRRQERARIEIGSRVSEKETIFFIRDNGVGFDMKYADKLFGVFQRLHSGTEFEGTGIGLANVRRIIQRHGGLSWAEGKVNGGATFYFSLPNQKEVPHEGDKIHTAG